MWHKRKSEATGGAQQEEMIITIEGRARELVHHRRRHPELTPHCRSFQLVPSSYKSRHHVDRGFHSRGHHQKTKMEGLKLSFIFLVVFGFVCLSDADTFPNLIPKSSNDNTNTDDKAAVSVASGDKSPAEAAATATTTSEPCGGLKGFLHICDKNESADPAKKVQKRSLSDDDSDDSSSSSDDSDDSDERPAEKSSIKTEGGVAKRQVEDPEAPDAPEEPPMVDSALPQPEDTAADLMALNKRQTDDSSSSEETEEDKRQ